DDCRQAAGFGRMGLGGTMTRLLWTAALAAVVPAGLARAALPEQIKIDAGVVTGTTSASPEIRVFKGIPFAAPPTGNNRWRPPQPVAHWSGIRPATEYGARCTQGGPPGGSNAAAAPPTSDDCLFLNVWTAASSASDRRPVMVWIYGGGFFGGAGSEARYAGD